MNHHYKCLCLALLLSGWQSMQAQTPPFAYSGFEGLAVGAVNAQSDNPFQWAQPWDVQNADAKYAVHNGSPLVFGNLATSSDGQYLNGGGDYVSMGRKLACGAGSVWDLNGYVSDPYSAGAGLDNIDQGSVWVSFLLRVNSPITSWDTARIGFTAAQVEWNLGAAGNLLEIASYNGGHSWGIQLGNNGTAVPLGDVWIGSNVLFVVKFELSPTPGANNAYVWMFVSPTNANLGGSDLDPSTATASLTGKNTEDLRFKGLGLYLDNAPDRISVDEFRFGPSYASVTPTAAGSISTPPAILTQPGGTGVIVGQPFSLFASANGSPAPALQWQKYGTNLVGQTSNTFSVASAAMTDAGDYNLLATNVAGTAASSVARVTVFSPITGNVQTYSQAAAEAALAGGSGDVGVTNGPFYLYPGHAFTDPDTATATPSATRYVGGTLSFSSTASEWGSAANVDLLAHDGSSGPSFQAPGGGLLWRIYFDGGNYAATTVPRSVTNLDFILKLSDDAYNWAKASLFLGTNADAVAEGAPDVATSFYNRDSINPLVALQSRLNVSGWADAASLSVSNLFSSSVWTSVPAANAVIRPALTVTRVSPTQVQMAWTPATAGFILQETTSLPGGWVNSASGATNPVVVTPAQPARFYRLFKP